MNKEINIVLSSSNEFIEHCATTMASILYNLSSDYFAHFYILSYNLSEKNKKKLTKLNKVKECTIEYPTFDEKLLDMFDGIKIPSHVTKMTYARILIPDILPRVNRCIFVDSDMVVRVDISELYSLDIGDNVFAAVEDSNWKIISNRLWNKEEYYFNAGLLLIDAYKLRCINYLSVIKKHISLNKDKYTICDQDVINDSFRGQIYRLSISWNFYHSVFFEKFKCYTPDNMEEFKKISKNPNIVHYVGPEKPWLPSVHHPFEKDYFFFNRMTVFYRLWRFQKYYLYGSKIKSICFYDIPIYIKTYSNGNKLIEIFGKKLSCFSSIKNLIINETKTEDSYKLKIFGIKVIHKKNAESEHFIKIFGIPFYYSVNKKISMADAQAHLLKQIMILKDSNNEILEQLNYQKQQNVLLNQKISNLSYIIAAQKLHEKTFAQYKNAFVGKDVVLVCTGPTANKYEMIPGAIHIGVNGAIYLKNILLDYLFVQDYTIHQKNNSTLNDDAQAYIGNNCKKFYGIIPDDRLSITHNYVERIPMSYSCADNVSQYLLEDIPFHNIAYDLSREPLGEFSGTPFSVLQFIFYTNPKRLYLVGWDCGAGYAYGKENAINPADYQIDVLKKYFIPYIKVQHPNLEIISINPVGLKGIFEDIYTKD